MLALLRAALIAALTAQSASADRTHAVELARTGHTAEALTLFERLVAITPDDVDARLWVARLHARLGQTARAEDEFRAVLRQHPSDVDGRIGLAGVLLRRSAWPEALSMLRDMEPAAGKNADFCAVLARAYHRAGDNSQALAYYARARALAPDDRDIRYAYEDTAELHAHSVAFEGFGEHIAPSTNAGSGTLTVAIRAQPRLRLDGQARIQNRGGNTDVTAGSGVEWRIGLVDTLHVRAVGGPGNVSLPIADVGCPLEDGRVTDVGLPRNWFARFQIVEYMRAFLLFRIGCALINAVPIISGAFGLFRRDALIAVGGYDHTAIGEDMDLTIRLHKHFRARGEPARIAFDPNPLAWTQVPEDRASLRSQRHRWRHGLLQVLWRHRGMIGNPRYGALGGSFLYVALFEGLGPLIEVAGYGVTLLAVVLGLLNWKYFWLLVVVSVMFGTGVTLLSLLLSDIATRRYMRGPELVWLVAAVLIECVGYRQLNSWWGCVGTVQAMRGKGGWGPMKRRAFQS